MGAGGGTVTEVPREMYACARGSPDPRAQKSHFKLYFLQAPQFSRPGAARPKKKVTVWFVYFFVSITVGLHPALKTHRQ